VKTFIRLGTIPACDGRTDRQTDGLTELPWLIQRSALQAKRPRCKNSTKTANRLVAALNALRYAEPVVPNFRKKSLSVRVFEFFPRLL